MADDKQAPKQRPEKRKAEILKSIGLFLICVVVVFGISYLLQTRFFRTGIFDVNDQNAPNAIEPSGKDWAERLELPGVPNFHKVSENLYRGGQPTAEGMQQLGKMGIKTVINLRSFHSDRDEIKGTALDYEHIYMKPWHAENKEVVRFLQIVTDPNRVPAFVHCQRGADRTGTMCSIYRIAVQGWSKSDAINEMTKGDFGFYSGWQNLVNYILKLDIDEIKRQSDLKE